jgi:hypothetical protein
VAPDRSRSIPADGSGKAARSPATSLSPRREAGLPLSRNPSRTAGTDRIPQITVTRGTCRPAEDRGRRVAAATAAMARAMRRRNQRTWDDSRAEQRRNAATKSSWRLGYLASNSSRRGMTTRSPAGWRSCGTFCRKISRINRLARFLLTESPILRLATIPSLVVPARFGAMIRVKNRPWTRDPVLNTCWNSDRRRTRRVVPKR